MMKAILEAGIPWKVFNFVVFIGLLVYFLRKPMKEFWISRSQKIQFEINEARRLYQEAEEKNRQLEGRLSKIQQEIDALIQSMDQDGVLEKKRIIAETEQMSLRMKKDAERIASQEIQRAKETLKAQAVQLSGELAERLIRENFKESDQKNVTQKYVSDLERAMI